MEHSVAFLETPLFAIVLCLLLGAIAVSGKFSQVAANLMLLGVCVVGSLQIHRQAQGQWRVVTGGILMLFGFCFLVSHWIKHEDAPKLSTVPIPSPSPVTTPPSVDELAEQIALRLDELRRKEEKPKEPFLMVVGTNLFSPERLRPLAVKLVRLSGRVTVTGINILLYLGVSNHLPGSTMLQGYSVEVKEKHKPWVKLKNVGTQDGEIVLALSKVGYSINQSKFFDREMAERTIKSGESVLGWVAVRYPDSIQKVLPKSQLRITVFDVQGNKSVIVPKAIANANNDDVMQGFGMQIGNQVDLSFLSTKPLPK